MEVSGSVAAGANMIEDVAEYYEIQDIIGEGATSTVYVNAPCMFLMSSCMLLHKSKPISVPSAANESVTVACMLSK